MSSLYAKLNRDHTRVVIRGITLEGHTYEVSAGIPKDGAPLEWNLTEGSPGERHELARKVARDWAATNDTIIQKLIEQTRGMQGPDSV